MDKLSLNRIFGAPVNVDESALVLRQIRHIWGMRDADKRGMFPMPIDMSEKDVNAIINNDYVCSPKHDGERGFIILFCLNEVPRAFVVTRKTDIYSITVDAHVSLFRYKGTLLDCEILPDKTNQEDSLKIVMFDCYSSRGCTTIGAENYSVRLREVDELRSLLIMIEPKLILMTKKIFKMNEFDLLAIELENAHEVYDGVVFTPQKVACTPGTNHKVLKFKFDPTVDLLLQNENGSDILLWDDRNGNRKVESRDFRVLLSTISIPNEFRHENAPTKAMVHEFSVKYDQVQKAIVLSWRRIRKDKKRPNFVTTVESVFRQSTSRLNLMEIFRSTASTRRPEHVLDESQPLVLRISRDDGPPNVTDPKKARSQSKAWYTRNEKRKGKDEKKRYLVAWKIMTPKYEMSLDNLKSLSVRPVRSLTHRSPFR